MGDAQLTDKRGVWWGARWQVGRAHGRGGYGAASRGAAAAGGAAWCGRGGFNFLCTDGRTRTDELEGSSAGPQGGQG